MKRLLLVVLCLVWIQGCAVRSASGPGPAASRTEGTFYVSPNGNDQWSGRWSGANLARSDGPFATLTRAVQAVREWRRQGAGTQDGSATILVRGGIYFLSEPLVLTPDDSNLTIAAFSGEAPIISGGRRIGGWKPVTVQGRHLWSAQLPKPIAGNWIFRELWVNGQRAIRARHPNHGYFQVEAVEQNKDWTAGLLRFRYRAGDLPEWRTLGQADVVVMNRWAESHLPVSFIEPEMRVVTFAKRSVFSLDAGDLYYVEGAFEALDEPGEWYLDAAAGTVYYLPRPGEDLRTATVVAPVLPQVVRCEGRPEAGRFVERMQWRGLTFAQTEWYFPEESLARRGKPDAEPPDKPEVGGFPQAAVGVPGAVWGSGVRDCLFDRCHFSHLGNYGLELTRGCQRNRVVGCEFSDLGAGGIKLGETSIRDSAADQTQDNEVSDCEIFDGGKMFPSAIGLWLGQTPNNRLLHNHIHDFYYTGISIGWTWGYGPARATNNLVAYNHVHHIGEKADGDGPILSDMGGIYTLGMQPGTRVLNNLWHDIAGLRYGGWGIYFDEGSSGIVAASNVVYHTTHGGFHQHYGATNLVRNNIFAFARDHQLQRTRVEPHLSFLFQTNIVYFDSGVLLGGDWSKDQYVMDWNVYFDARANARPEDLRFQGASLADWRRRGHDEHSVVADPLFVAPKQNDFRLQPDSPALKLGFEPIDLRPVGVRGQAERGTK